jgi:KTSC domain-containing protein
MPRGVSFGSGPHWGTLDGVPLRRLALRFCCPLVCKRGVCDSRYMQRHPVASRALVSVGYQPDTGALELEFRSGRVYAYRGVPESVYAWLLRTKNKGIFVAHHLSGRYGEHTLPDPGAPSQPSLEQALLASLSALSRHTRE